MTAPKRWIHTPDESTDEERSLLMPGLDVGPPPDAEDRTWQSILAQLGPFGTGGPPPTAPTPAPPAPPAPTAAPVPLPPPAGVASPLGAGGLAGASKVGSLAGAAKIGLLAVVASALVVAGSTTLRGPASPASAPTVGTETVRPTEQHPELPDRRVFPAASASADVAPEPTSMATVASPVQTPVPPASEHPAPALIAPERASEPVAPRGFEAATPRGSALAPTPLAPDPVAPAPVVSGSTLPVASTPAAASGSSGVDPAPSPQARRASQLREESALVGQANAALRGGNAGEALRLLNEASARFPGGVLGQERELLTIEALALSGQRAAASQRAEQFLRAHPGSPHAARLRPYVP